MCVCVCVCVCSRHDEVGDATISVTMLAAELLRVRPGKVMISCHQDTQQDQDHHCSVNILSRD